MSVPPLTAVSLVAERRASMSLCLRSRYAMRTVLSAVSEVLQRKSAELRSEGGPSDD